MESSTPLLNQVYTAGSLEHAEGGWLFRMRNRLFDTVLTGVERLSVDGEPVDLARVVLDLDGATVQPAVVTPEDPLKLPLRQRIVVRVAGPALAEGPHQIAMTLVAEHVGAFAVEVDDDLAAVPEAPLARVPRDPDDDHAPGVVAARQRFLHERTGVELRHLTSYSFDPALARGNVEGFVGVAQVPIGLAGPLLVDGEHARGEFLIPLATSEGTLVASYNRGMKVLNASGGVRVSVVDDVMQRAPVFVFDDARAARDFKAWVEERFADLKRVAEETTTVGRLVEIDTYLASKMAFLRFNFTTGDAAGQNMVGRATFAACSWLLEHNPTIRRFFLESNFATDKKASGVNVMRTRGKRVTAEVIVAKDVLSRVMRVRTESLHYHAGVANVGALMSGANNNGLHSANGITALFIATGQDVANVAESSAGILYTDLLPDGDLYVSITIPSLIVATHGGGTGLATQRECLAILGCTGPGTVDKLAEIVAAVVLAGEISLAAAISSLDWVTSHEQYGRNR
ncbi:MAG: hydroxymethylglutaryl-CoA reductase [Actinomycetota bacterium]|jgi:hydroxymethylglutaryl-CoA reductase (NADPH)|nr:hydroxymethylglutaryl-CoA reductase [Actinomycetota bacterium]